VAGGRPETARWRQSSSCNGGSCVEVAHLGGAIAVRDSVDPDGVVLTCRERTWREFVADVKTGAFRAAG
jgi:hypothetical protein